MGYLSWLSRDYLTDATPVVAIVGRSLCSS